MSCRLSFNAFQCRLVWIFVYCYHQTSSVASGAQNSSIQLLGPKSVCHWCECVCGYFRGGTRIEKGRTMRRMRFPMTIRLKSENNLLMNQKRENKNAENFPWASFEVNSRLWQRNLFSHCCLDTSNWVSSTSSCSCCVQTSLSSRYRWLLFWRIQQVWMSTNLQNPVYQNNIWRVHRIYIC